MTELITYPNKLSMWDVNQPQAVMLATGMVYELSDQEIAQGYVQISHTVKAEIEMLSPDVARLFKGRRYRGGDRVDIAAIK